MNQSMKRRESLAVAAGAASALVARYLAPGLLDSEYIMLGLVAMMLVLELAPRTQPKDRG